MAAPQPHLALFLDTRPRPEEDTSSDILYAYPPPETRNVNQASVERLKGVFVALNGVMRMLTGQSCNTASFEQHQDERMPDGSVSTRSVKLLAIYAPLETALFVAVLPKNVPEALASALVREFLSSLRFLAGSLEGVVRGPDGAAGDPSRPRRLATQLDPLFARFFEVALSEDALHQGFFAALGMGAKFFHPSMEVRAQLGDTLNSLLSPNREYDYVTSGGRSCLPLGACLFHRGVLVASAMGAGDLRDVARFCAARRLFGAPVDAGETVIVQQVFREGYALLFSWPPPFDLPCHPLPPLPPPPPTHTHHPPRAGPFGRWPPEKAAEGGGEAPPGAVHPCVLVCVAQSQQLLCLLLYPRFPTLGQIDPYQVPEPHAAALLDPKRWAAASADAPWQLLKISPELCSLGFGLQITAGRPNVLLHYVLLYPPSGTLLAPLLPGGSAPVPPLLAAARREFFKAYAALRGPLVRCSGGPARSSSSSSSSTRRKPPSEESREEQRARAEAERSAMFERANGPGPAAGLREVGALLSPSEDPHHPSAFVAAGRLWGPAASREAWASSNNSRQGFEASAEVFTACHASVPQSAADLATRLLAGARLS
eukprot:tig00000076_g2345.t1